MIPVIFWWKMIVLQIARQARLSNTLKRCTRSADMARPSSAASAWRRTPTKRNTTCLETKTVGQYDNKLQTTTMYDENNVKNNTLMIKNSSRTNKRNYRRIWKRRRTRTRRQTSKHPSCYLFIHTRIIQWTWSGFRSDHLLIISFDVTWCFVFWLASVY